MEFTVSNLTKQYGKKTVLQDLSFTFESGKIYGLLGRNGAGKTTLFNCINRDIPINSGSFTLTDGGQNRQLQSSDIGYVLSTPTVPEFLTGREFLKFFLEVNQASIAEPQPLDAYFDWVKIDPEDRDRLMKDYSHGMKNKMQMLVHLIARPNLLLLDEPLTSLDVVVAEQMKQLLRTVKTDRILIFSTHILDLALDLCDEIVLLHQGALQAVDKPALGDASFKEKIIAALQEDDHV